MKILEFNPSTEVHGELDFDGKMLTFAVTYKGEQGQATFSASENIDQGIDSIVAKISAANPSVGAWLKPLANFIEMALGLIK
jgi:hypothetical protein